MNFSTYSETNIVGLKPPSVTKNVVGMQINDAGHVDLNSSADVACVVGLQTDAVVVTETRFSFFGFHFKVKPQLIIQSSTICFHKKIKETLFFQTYKFTQHLSFSTELAVYNSSI